MGDGASQSWGAKNRNKQWLSIQKQVTIKSFGMSHQMAWKQLLFVSEIHAKIKPGCQFSYFISKFAWKRTDVEPFPGVSTYLRGWFLDHKPLECHSRTSNIINLHFLASQIDGHGTKYVLYVSWFHLFLPQWNWSKTYQSPSLPCTPVRHWLSAPHNLVISQFFLEKWSKYLVVEDEMTKEAKLEQFASFFKLQASHPPTCIRSMELLNQGVLHLAIFCLKNCHFACARMLASGDSRRVVLLLLIFAKEQQVFELPSKFSRKNMAQNASRFLPNNRTSQML